ncbi:MAG: long-chain-fatty-acid--CoA ligase [Pseudoclavibacter sp.]
MTSRPWIDSYAEGVPADIPERYDTLSHAFERSVTAYSQRVATDFLGGTLTYADLGAQVHGLAQALLDLGVERGDRVALVMPNCPQHVVAFYAVLRIGAVVVEHNPQYTAAELGAQFADHGARVAIVWDSVADLVAGFPADRRPEHLIAVNLIEALPLRSRLALRLPISRARTMRAALSSPCEAAVLSFHDLTELTAPIPADWPMPALGDLAALQYTSGTTGRPKAAMLTHRNLRSNELMGEAWVPGLRRGQEVFACVLPFFHAYGLTLCLAYGIAMGATLALQPKFDLDLLIAAQRRRPITFLPAVPPIYDRLCSAAEAGRVDLHSVRFSISGAMTLHADLVDRWERLSGGLLVEGYGMTEASPIIAGNPIGPSRRPGTVGVPFPSTDIRIAEIDDPHADAAPGSEGELLVRGPQVFAGYWQRPELTAETLIDGEWLRTGDIVVQTEDGYLSIVDRSKELIVTGGFNVSPSEVEAVLCTHHDVRAAAVVGERLESGNERVTAALVLRDGAALDRETLVEHCRRTLARYKVPRAFVVVESLPTSMLGKVLRRAVREQLFATSTPAVS